jgi:SAM-dependent methyltransferase
MDIQRTIYAGLDAMTPPRREFLHRAYRALPPMEKPRILDLGCGRGGPTLELARLGGGEVVGVDIDAAALAELAAAAEAARLGRRIRVLRVSMHELDELPGDFDLLWAEGAIHVVGFEAGLRAGRRLLRPGGCFVVHEMAWLKPDPPREIAAYWQASFAGIRTLEAYAAAVPACGYRLLASFALPRDFWWENYYALLDQRLKAVTAEQADAAAAASVRAARNEVDLYKRYRDWYGSVYLILQRDETYEEHD